LQLSQNDRLQSAATIDHDMIDSAFTSALTLRVPKDKAADFSAAEIHLATIKELSKQDNNLITLDQNTHVFLSTETQSIYLL
jgi:hypothetical protein